MKTRTICQFSGSDTARYLLFQIQPSCKYHRHYTRQEAVRLIQHERATYVGPKQLCLTENHKIILCICPDLKQVSLTTRKDAEELCTTGHARWKRANVIEIERNIPLGPALSLLIGEQLAIALQQKENKDWAQTAVGLIVGRK